MIVNDSETTLGIDPEGELMKTVEIEVDQEIEIEIQELLVDEGTARNFLNFLDFFRKYVIEPT